jgi:hypothetical protein
MFICLLLGGVSVEAILASMALTVTMVISIPDANTVA